MAKLHKFSPRIYKSTWQTHFENNKLKVNLFYWRVVSKFSQIRKLSSFCNIHLENTVV